MTRLRNYVGSPCEPPDESGNEPVLPATYWLAPIPKYGESDVCFNP